MEGSEIRRWFYILISDDRGEMRDEARQRIIEAGGEDYAALARAGALIGDAICGEGGAGAIEVARREFGGLPLSSEWNGYREAAGGVLIAAAGRLRGRDPAELEEMLEGGLQLLANSQDGGFPLSKSSIDIVKPLAGKEGRAGTIADSILKQNALIMPETRDAPRRPREKKGKGPATGRMKGTA